MFRPLRHVSRARVGMSLWTETLADVNKRIARAERLTCLRGNALLQAQAIECQVVVFYAGIACFSDLSNLAIRFFRKVPPVAKEFVVERKLGAVMIESHEGLR